MQQQPSQNVPPEFAVLVRMFQLCVQPLSERLQHIQSKVEAMEEKIESGTQKTGANEQLIKRIADEQQTQLKQLMTELEAMGKELKNHKETEVTDSEILKTHTLVFNFYLC